MSEQFNAASFREDAYQTPRKIEDVATPWWPKWNGHMAIADVPMHELTAMQSLARADSAAYSAALIIKTLIIKDTGEQAFQETDRDYLGQNGSIVMELMREINAFFGFDTKDAIALAKNA